VRRQLLLKPAKYQRIDAHISDMVRKLGCGGTMQGVVDALLVVGKLRCQLLLKPAEYQQVDA
jgi:hypothetical protein